MNQTILIPHSESENALSENEVLRLELQHLREKNHQLQQELHQMKDFMKAIGHDLGAPINGLEHLLSDFNIPSFTENFIVYYEIYQLSCRLLRDLMENTKAYLNTGNDDPVFTEVDTINLIDSISQVSKVMASSYDIDLKLKITPETPEIIQTDRAKLTRITFNLLSNAVKFSPKGSTINLSTGGNDTNFTLTVEDQGIGIAPDKIHTIFEPGVRLDKSKEGLGVGLHISQRFTSQLNGALKVTSEPKQGSTFTLILPVALPRQTILVRASEIT